VKITALCNLAHGYNTQVCGMLVDPGGMAAGRSSRHFKDLNWSAAFSSLVRSWV
jgi:hypothetical protein